MRTVMTGIYENNQQWASSLDLLDTENHLKAALNPPLSSEMIRFAWEALGDTIRSNFILWFFNYGKHISREIWHCELINIYWIISGYSERYQHSHCCLQYIWTETAVLRAHIRIHSWTRLSNYMNSKAKHKQLLIELLYPCLLVPPQME